MAEINFNEFFKDEEDRYYNHTYLAFILSSIFDMPFEAIIEDSQYLQMTVTPEQITIYLNTVFKLHEEEISKKADEDTTTSEGTKKQTKRWMLSYYKDKCTLEQYTFDYYKKYIEILRTKVGRLLTIIAGISRGDIAGIKEELEKLDIVLDENGNILRSDIERLVVPTVENIRKLESKVEEANDFSSYFDKKREKHLGFSEDEIYPLPDLQEPLRMFNHSSEYVMLSKRQKEKLEAERTASRKRFGQYLKNIGL